MGALARGSPWYNEIRSEGSGPLEPTRDNASRLEAASALAHFRAFWNCALRHQHRVGHISLCMRPWLIKEADFMYDGTALFQEWGKMVQEELQQHFIRFELRLDGHAHTSV